MIICICNNINNAAIEASINDGAQSLDDIRNRTGAGSCCGKCQFKVNRILQSSTDANAEPLFTEVKIRA